MLLAAITLGAPPARAQTTDAVLDTLQHTAFDYFWNEANPSNGMIRDRSTATSPASIAAVGFGLSAICIGSDHGWVSRASARDRVLTTLQTFWNGPQGTAASGTIGFQGLFYHFLDMNTATRTWDSEVSTIDTALLFAGILDAKQYFNNSGDPGEVQVRALADSITRRANWFIMRNFSPGIYMGWKPGTNFGGFGKWVGYNEAMVMYLIAMGSPTHPVPSGDWTTWTGGYNWSTQYGHTYVVFPPLFGHQYSHCWIDFRSIQDAYMRGKGSTYFINSREATLAQQAYCIANPGGWAGYSSTQWGLTAGDGPFGYNARGAPPAQNDDGTIAPTAAISSLPFAPEIVLPTIDNLWTNYRALLFGPYGFRDGFNLTQAWFDTDVLGIDQGPIIMMIENYRTGSVWNRFMLNPDIQNGLVSAGFSAVLAVPPPMAPSEIAFSSSPNPWTGSTSLQFRLPSAGPVRLSVYDLAGREELRLVDGVLSAGDHSIPLAHGSLGAGLHLYRLDWNGTHRTLKGIRLP
jgi:hypothetical protein